MSCIWIIDVLSDLRQFADENGMSSLAEELDTTLAVARADIEKHNRDTAAQIAAWSEDQTGLRPS